MQLLTGRTHQIRVHMKHVGTPILGDSVYGSTSANVKYKPLRQMLHAHRIEFTHPMTGNEIQLCAPIPKDLLSYIDLLK
jgi:23S rRNA pseudouridine1911/1915/1917 synthase